MSLTALACIIKLFLAEMEQIELSRRVCQWWISGRTPDGHERSFLLRSET
eukprot:m.15871 g.15871  ORF g.15871 m.15871 type:complete len:50 (+) comp8668_c0_seq1:1-150(+)